MYKLRTSKNLKLIAPVPRLLMVTIFSVLTNTTTAQVKDSTSSRLTQKLGRIYAQGHINGFAVAVVNQDSILYTKGFGFADIKQNKPYTNSTVQNIASISKTFIGVALLKAQELGKLRLDDPINKYLPFTIVNPYFPKEEITLRQLANHTSSIQDPLRYELNGYILKQKNNPNAKVKINFRAPDKMLSMDEFFRRILVAKGKWYKKKNFLKKKPGDTFEYSNVAAALAAYIIEQATGEAFPKFTAKYIFEPLGMSATGWSFNDIDFTKHSILYKDTDTELAFYRLVTYPDGGLITSSTDLGKFLSELIAGYGGHGKILNEENFDELFKPQLVEENHEDRNEGKYNDEYNMGVFMGISAKGQIGHTGGDPGVATYMFFDTNTKIGKLLMVNTDLGKEGVKEFIDLWRTLETYETKL